MISDNLYNECRRVGMNTIYIGGGDMHQCEQRFINNHDLDAVISDEAIAVRRGRYIVARAFNESSSAEEVLAHVYLYHCPEAWR